MATIPTTRAWPMAAASIAGRALALVFMAPIVAVLALRWLFLCWVIRGDIRYLSKCADDTLDMSLSVHEFHARLDDYIAERDLIADRIRASAHLLAVGQETDPRVRGDRQGNRIPRIKSGAESATIAMLLIVGVTIWAGVFLCAGVAYAYVFGGA